MVLPPLLVALAALTVLWPVAASPFEPHLLPRSGPWFEGWFLRVVDPAAERSVAVIVGSFQPKGQPLLASTWAAALVSEGALGTTKAEQVFPDQASVTITDRGQSVTREPSREQAAVFSWASELGRFDVNDGNATLDFAFPSGLSFSVSLTGRVPWDPSCPNACGPEGYVARLPQRLVPTHYFVHSVASRAAYRLNGVAGSGYAHQEANYGARFPAAWVWVQGIAEDGRTQLVLTGGDFTIAGVTTRQFVIGYRSQRRSWNFRNVNSDRIHSKTDACNGTLSVSAMSACGRRRFEVLVTAPPPSFSKALYFPTPYGFSNDPGCVESYQATAVVQLFEDDSDKPAEHATLRQVALEFGGGDRCPARRWKTIIL